MSPHKVPIVNLVWDTFFAVPPTPAQLRDALNLLALLDALVLSVMLTLPFNHNYDDWMAGIERLNYTPFLTSDGGVLPKRIEAFLAPLRWRRADAFVARLPLTPFLAPAPA